MIYAVLAVGIYSFGHGIFMPFSALAGRYFEGKERAGIYSLLNTVTAILSAIIGSVSGFIYGRSPLCFLSDSFYHSTLFYWNDYVHCI